MHESFMREAIALAMESVRTAGGGPFGAVIVQAGRIVGSGANRVTASNDPTAHAEIVAIRDAGQTLKTFCLQGCEIYTSCEPCPMCLSALYWARVERIFFSACRHDAAASGFDDALIYQELGLDVAARRLPMVGLLPGEGLAPFEAWKTSPQRIPY